MSPAPTAFVTLDEERCTSVNLHVSGRGPWQAEVDLEAEPLIGERCALRIGGMLLSGSVLAVQAGAFGAQRKLRLVAGGGGWGASVPSKAYHNDAGVKTLHVAQDAARAVGEVLGQFVPARERLGADYVRDGVRVASRVLEDAIGSAGWWVDYDGITHVGERPTARPLPEASFQVLAFDPRSRMATLAVDDPALVSIGTTLAGAGLPAAQVVREFEVVVSAEGVRVVAWCGGEGRSTGRLADAWRALVERTEVSTLTGLYRYRVVAMASDGRVSLQAARKAIGLPDIDPIAQWPGVAGVHAELAKGAEVLVAFIEGDRSQPVVTHYSGKGGEGFVPAHITLGGTSGPPAARQGDTVKVLLPPATFTGSIGAPPVPATGVIVWSLNTALGTITTGSGKVDIA